MKDLLHLQKVAVMRILLDIVLADNRVDSREVEFYRKISDALGFPSEVNGEVQAMNSLLALTYLDEMTEEQKRLFVVLMGKMIVADKDINPNEVKIYNIVRDVCHIPEEFDFDCL